MSRRERDPAGELCAIFNEWRLHGYFGNPPPRFDAYRDADARAEAVAGYFSGVGGRWKPIESAPRDQRIVVFAPGAEFGLPDMICVAEYHADAGFCVCELRYPTLWAEWIAG